jgi:ketosteroid isomerase-like protein
VSANVEIVRRGIEAWNQRDVHLLLSYAAPEIEWMPAGPAVLEHHVYRGYEEAASGFAAAWDTWEVFEFQEDEVRDLGDSVLWLGRVKLRGGASGGGVELDQAYAIHCLLSDAKFIRVQAFRSWDDALEAVGLKG